MEKNMQISLFSFVICWIHFEICSIHDLFQK